MSDLPAYQIDPASVERAFPPGESVPALLTDFMRWLEGRAWGSVGRFRVEGTFADRAPIYDGTPLRADFALFLYLPDGSQAGLWRAGRPSLEGAPFVLVDSEGQYKTLAPTLESFLVRLALRGFQNSDLDVHDDEDNALEALADWLIERFGGDRFAALSEWEADGPDFRAAMYGWSEAREAYWSRHPVLSEVSARLVRLRPEGKTAWDTTMFEIAIVGAQYGARVLMGGRKPFPEAAAIEAPLRALREEMARERPQLGLWFQMSFSLHADGRLFPNFDYETRPEIDGAPADLAQARADLSRASRPARWVPLWAA